MSDPGAWWAAPEHASPPARRPDFAAYLAGILAGALALTVALAGASVIVDHGRRPLSTTALPGVLTVPGAHPRATDPVAPKPQRLPTPQPVLTVAQVTRAVEPGVVVIESTLGYQNAEAAGTGMVLTPTGEILTNNHVIAGATKILVTVAQTHAQYTADVVGTSVANDVAVLQLQGASGLATIPLGDSSGVVTGQPAVAIGNAGGGGVLTVVTGNITSTDRAITATDETGTSSEQLTGMLEVQAPIKAGDSGGPLANRGGRVIGMDTAASATDGHIRTAPTVGFAIPINRALAVARQIRKGGLPAGRGYLGIQVTSNGGVTGPGGARVVATTVGSPAAAAGIEPGDTITYLNGAPVSSADALTNSLAASRPGQNVTVGWTDTLGQAHSAQVTLTNGPAA